MVKTPYPTQAAALKQMGLELDLPAENGAPKRSVAQHLGSVFLAASLAASRSVRMGKAPTLRADNATVWSSTTQTTRSTAGVTFSLVINISQSLSILLMAHLFGGRCYLPSTTTGPFVPASRDANKQSPSSYRLLRPSDWHTSRLQLSTSAYGPAALHPGRGPN